MHIHIWNILVIAVTVAAVSLALTFLLFPTFLKSTIGVTASSANDWPKRVLLRYQTRSIQMGYFAINPTFAWVFAWFKLRLDPMFRELPVFLRPMSDIQTALDLGCGNGVAGCALLEWRPNLKIYGIDPNAARVRTAAGVFASRGSATPGRAPDFENPNLPPRVDLVLLLDVIHFMPDEAVTLTLQRIRARLDNGGYLIIRAIISPAGKGSWPWKIAAMRRRMTGSFVCHHSIERIRQMLTATGFDIEMTQPSGGNPELRWFIAKAIRNDAKRAATGQLPTEHGR